MTHDQRASPATLQLIGRSSSHFTRVAAIFAHELGVPFTLVPVHDMKRLDADAYGGNPALKLPTLRTPTLSVFGTENICRKLAQLAPRRLRVVWPEDLTFDVGRNAQELLSHSMAAQVQLIVAPAFAKLPADNVYVVKGRTGFAGALRWLDERLAEVLEELPSPRDLSLFEVTLFCLVEHIDFCKTLPLAPYPKLARFTEEFAARDSAQRTRYYVDRHHPNGDRTS